MPKDIHKMSTFINYFSSLSTLFDNGFDIQIKQITSKLHLKCQQSPFVALFYQECESSNQTAT